MQTERLLNLRVILPTANGNNEIGHLVFSCLFWLFFILSTRALLFPPKFFSSTPKRKKKVPTPNHTKNTARLSEQRTIQKNGRERKYHHQNETKNWSETRSRYRWRWICRVALVRCLGRSACFYSLSSRHHHTRVRSTTHAKRGAFKHEH